MSPLLRLPCRVQLAAAAVLAVAGCASAPTPQASQAADTERRSEFDVSLDAWNGAPLAELLKKLGKPSSVAHRPDGSSLYSFTKSTPASAQTGMSSFSCTVRYVVDDKTRLVRSHRIEGC
jgi:hypothetical protein